jgi:hypothetical protein
MSSYHTSFTYKGISSEEKGLVICSFEPDSGHVTSFLGMDSITEDNVITGVRHDYGAKYKEVAMPKITMINFDGSEFSVSQFRDIVRWLSGARISSWLDLYENNELAYSFLCKCTDVQQYKLDGRTIGVTVTFTAVSPWAYSPIQQIAQQISHTASVMSGDTIKIDNLSDEGYAYVYPDITFECYGYSALAIYNEATDETTTVSNMTPGEIITMTSNQVIYSNTGRIIGDDFNFVWPKFLSGTNALSVLGQGHITISYRYPIKAGDCILNTDTEMSSDMCVEASQELATDGMVASTFNRTYRSVFGG